MKLVSTTCDCNVDPDNLDGKSGKVAGNFIGDACQDVPCFDPETGTKVINLVIPLGGIDPIPSFDCDIDDCGTACESVCADCGECTCECDGVNNVNCTDCNQKTSQPCICTGLFGEVNNLCNEGTPEDRVPTGPHPCTFDDQPGVTDDRIDCGNEDCCCPPDVKGGGQPCTTSVKKNCTDP